MSEYYFENESNNKNNETNATVEPVVSEPYRYKYENGEKKETTENAGSYGYGAYDTYRYQNYSYTTTAEPPKKKKRTGLKAIKWIAAAACFGIIAGAAFLGTTYLASEVLGFSFAKELVNPDGTAVADGQNTVGGTGVPLNITLGAASTIQGVQNPAENVVVQVVEQNLAATVAVKSTFVETYSYWGQQYQQEKQGSGSGFIVGKNDTELLIATNNHVIDNAKKIEVSFIDDSILEATVKGNDSMADLAIIAVPLDTISASTLTSIRVATLGDSESVKMGEMAIAIGNALGYGQSVTVGYISAKDRTVTIDNKEMVLLQTDAAINGGNSGGPLFNIRGEVIGINSAKYADTDVEGMCFAIPISRAIPILNELMTRETLADDERGFLGVSTRDVTSDLSSFYGWPMGAYIVSVLEGSPAENAGIYVGDIVTGVNGVKIVTADQLVAAVSSYRHGTTVDLTVQRINNGTYEEFTIKVTLAKRSDVESAAEPEATPSDR